MSIIIPANSASAAGGFQVANSVRFNGGSNDHLKKTFGTPTNAQKYTMSWWFKGTGIATGSMFEAASGNAQNGAFVYLKTDDLQINSIVGNSEVMKLIPNAHYQDYSAWYHLCFAVDVTLGTASDRNKLYINGERVTSFVTQTNAPQNTNGMFNTAIEHLIGIDIYNSGGSLATPFNGYISEFVFIDGSQLAPTDFGEFDSDSGIWKPIDGLADDLTFGDNGFYLDFQDSSNLGNDVSGENNDFTVVNLTATSQSTDTCTNNFCTWNSLDNFYQESTFQQGNLQVRTKSPGVIYSYETYNTGTIGVSSGKWFWEVKFSAVDSGSSQIGVVDNGPTAATQQLGARTYGWSYTQGGSVDNNGSSVSGSWASYTTGDIIGVALNLDDNQLTFYKNGAVQNSGTAISITAPASTTSGFYFPAGGDNNAGNVTLQANFGSPPYSESGGKSDGNGYGNFSMVVPSGYFALNTKNIAEYG